MKFCRSDRPLNTRFVARAVALVVLASASLAGCALPPVQHGYVLSEEALSQVPVGSSREQVQLVLGSPSTTSSVAGDAYYYISQTQVESPIWGRSITDQHILAVYFDEKGLVKQIANFSNQQSILARELQLSVTKLNKGSEQTVTAISEQSRSTNTLVKYSARLAEAVGRFKLPEPA